METTPPPSWYALDKGGGGAGGLEGIIEVDAGISPLNHLFHPSITSSVHPTAARFFFNGH